MSYKKNTLLLLHILSMVLLALGLFRDMLQIDISAHFIVEIKLFNESRSIIGVLKTLWKSSNYFPFLLIFIFGIIIPLTKSLIIFNILFRDETQQLPYHFISHISKWAMADVFAISIFVAFLGANAMDNTKAIIQDGYYFFTAYVLLSAIITPLVVKMNKSSQ